MRHPTTCFSLALLMFLSACAGPGSIGYLAAPLEAFEPWAELSVRSALARRITERTVHVGNLDAVNAGRPPEQWLRRTTRLFGGARRVQWTDTRSCTAARAVLSSMYALEIPRPSEGGLIEVRADGILYTLITAGQYGSVKLARITISGSGGTPLGDWAERSLAELEPCWADHPPTNGVQSRSSERRLSQRLILHHDWP